jgi:hypothetical protein
LQVAEGDVAIDVADGPALRLIDDHHPLPALLLESTRVPTWLRISLTK